MSSPKRKNSHRMWRSGLKKKQCSGRKWHIPELDRWDCCLQRLPWHFSSIPGECEVRKSSSQRALRPVPPQKTFTFTHHQSSHLTLLPVSKVPWCQLDCDSGAIYLSDCITQQLSHLTFLDSWHDLVWERAVSLSRKKAAHKFLLVVVTMPQCRPLSTLLRRRLFFTHFADRYCLN